MTTTAPTRAQVQSCHRCAATYEATRSDSRYCGAACRSAAHRERERATVRDLAEVVRALQDLQRRAGASA